MSDWSSDVWLFRSPPVRRPGPNRPWRDRSPERTDDRSDEQTVGRVGRWATHEWTPPKPTSRTRPGGHERARLSQSSRDEDSHNDAEDGPDDKPGRRHRRGTAYSPSPDAGSGPGAAALRRDRKSTRLNSSH